MIVAMAVNTEGKRETVGLHIGPSEAEIFWSTLVKSLVERVLRRTNPRINSGDVISDTHEAQGGDPPSAGVRVIALPDHLIPNALTYAGKPTSHRPGLGQHCL